MTEREGADREVERPVDGPGRGAGGPGEDLGRSSQGEPGDRDAAAGSEEDPGRGGIGPEHPDDTNERADDRARVLEPDSDEESPRADL